ncbi:thioesterase family protein [Beauveria brongniartii RCEF 3172]|uniref:Thioesterase family protein n=1 Tax=Beauveria brongniartii RCEF 3172 TaxID=1081107 RepID=A0A166YI19_9HYPO|nr:thioesterase family protein [Beauveria brongniartii RCEF 3172]
MPDLQSARLVDFVGKVPIDQAAVDYFSTVPHAGAYLDRSRDLLPVPFYSRSPKTDAADTFFGETIKSPDTIPHALLLLRGSIARLEYKFDDSSSSSSSSSASSSSGQPDTVALFQLGIKLNGYRDTTHGGVLASLLDEVVGYNVDGLCGCIEAQQGSGASRNRLYTAYLNTTYKRPVSPGVYAVESGLVRRDGRKWFLEGRIVGAEGVVHTEAQVLYIQSRDGVL